jgi:histidinol-phosphatase (PHP family)
VGFVNYHTHSNHCDGVRPPADYVREAKARGFDALGFSAHAPMPFHNTWSIKPGKLDAYLKDIRALKKKHDGLQVLLALEADYIPGVSTAFADWKKNCGLDYIIGGVHLVATPGRENLWFIDGGPINYEEGLKHLFNMNIRRAVGCYFSQLWEMIMTEKPDIIAHPDKIKMNNRGLYFSTEDEWYLKYISETVDVIAKSGAVTEVNTRGIYKKRCPETYPSLRMLKEFQRRHVPVVISTDAHHPSEIALQIPETTGLLKEIGFRETMVFRDGGWHARPL